MLTLDSNFLQTYLAPFAQRSPQLYLHVSPRPSRSPVIRAHYLKHPPKSVCVHNMHAEQILRHAERLRDASGAKNRRVKSGKFVQSMNESVRGVWSGMHEAMDGRAGGAERVWEWGGGRASIGRGKAERRKELEAPVQRVEENGVSSDVYTGASGTA